MRDCQQLAVVQKLQRFKQQAERNDLMKLSEVNAGDRLVADGGFTCMREGQIGVVFLTDDGKPALPCDAGCHTLDGQADEVSGEVIGLMLAPEYDG